MYFVHALGAYVYMFLSYNVYIHWATLYLDKR